MISYFIRLNMWIDRSLTPKIAESLRTRPVTLVSGARQTGKSSLVQRMCPDATYVTFDHLLQMEAALANPDHFLGQFTGPVILDEVQYVPTLFRDLKIRVDKDRQNYGKWLLTGSHQSHLMEQSGESLAGRIGILQLETLSASELRSANHPSERDFLWKGGYPELWENPEIDTQLFFDGYIRTYIERDLRQIVAVNRLSQFQTMLRLLATRVGQLLNFTELAREVGATGKTIKEWIHALEVSGLIYLLPPYHRNLGKRLVKTPKVYFADHGLLCHLLGIQSQMDWQFHVHRGSVWENIVLMELIRTRFLRPGVDLFFYRDQNGVEIDFVIEQTRTGRASISLIEAKSGERLDHLKLNFNKVLPLIRRAVTQATVIQIIAANIPDKAIFDLKGYKVYNPLLTELDF